MDKRNEAWIKRSLAFTLAEALITLAIIGVVAALTIPTVVAKYQKKQTEAQLKKMYSAISNAIQDSIVDNGSVSTWESPSHGNNSALIAFLDKYIRPYLNTKGDYTFINLQREGYKTSDGAICGPQGSILKFYLADGSTIMSTFYNGEYNGLGHTEMLQMFFDINGDKGPNQVGRDLFRYYLVVSAKDPALQAGTGKLVTTYFRHTRSGLLNLIKERKSDINLSSLLYAELLLRDSWQIKDDYPW